MKIGIDIGGSHIATGIVEKGGNLIGKETKNITMADVKSEKKAEETILKIIEEQINSLLKKYDYDLDDISFIGLAVPGSPSETAIINSVNLNIKKFEIAKILEEKYNAKIKLKNDGKCAGLAEKEYGALKKYDDCVFLCLGTGVGSAVFLRGDLLEPKNNPGFELGHIVIDKNGIKCNCGNKGCFETFASMKRFKKEAIKKFDLDKECESEEVQQYIRKNINDAKVKKFVSEYIDNLAIGISNIINIFEPEAICFGGSFAYYADIFIPMLKKEIKKYIFNKGSDPVFVCAKHQNDAGIIGATEI